MSKLIIGSVFAVILALVWNVMIVFILTYLAMITWNMFCGYAKLAEIGFWQMFGLMMFLSILKIMFQFKIGASEK